MNVLQSLPLTSSEARMYYNTIYTPSITYPLPSMTLQHKDCDSLQQKFKSTILPKLGFNRNLPLHVVYRNKQLGGVALRSMYLDLGIAQVVHFIKSL